MQLCFALPSRNLLRFAVRVAINAAISSALVRREMGTFRDGRQQGHVETGKVKHNLCLFFTCTLQQRMGNKQGW